MTTLKTKYFGAKSFPIGSPGEIVTNEIVEASVDDMKIGTSNARSFFSAGKFDNIVREISRLSTRILGVSDVECSGNGSCKTDNGTFYYSGNDDPAHLYGVGVILDNKTHMGVMNIVQRYAPTAEREEGETEEFYAGLDTVFGSINTTSSH